MNTTTALRLYAKDDFSISVADNQEMLIADHLVKTLAIIRFDDFETVVKFSKRLEEIKINILNKEVK